LISQTITSGAGQNYSWVYDRYGNRWQENPNGAQMVFNKANNQITTSGYSYDAAGNLISDGVNPYSYDAEGNLVQEITGSGTVKFSYNALNQQVRTDWLSSGSAAEVAFNLSGQLASLWWASDGSLLLGKAYLGSIPLESYLPRTNMAYFQHRDWENTERVITDASGNVTNIRISQPFGDGAANTTGSRDNTYDGFTGLWDGAASSTNHAQYREYSNIEGRWLSPDPYDGSYDLTNPQSFNRYSYVGNNPLGFVDPSGLDGKSSTITTGGCTGAIMSGGAAWGADLACLFGLLHLFGGPSFHGTLRPRPEGTGNPDWANVDGSLGETLGLPSDINWSKINPGIAGALGLPDAGCEFGSCGDIGSIASSFTQGAAIAAPLTWCGEHPTICTAGADLAAFVRAIPAVTASVLLLRMEGDGPATAPGVDRAACYEQYERDLDVCRKNHKRSCYAQAMERYSACLAGKSAPPFNF